MEATHYKIIYSDNYERLESQVNTYIKNGWQPKGGITTDKFGRVLQAIILPSHTKE